MYLKRFRSATVRDALRAVREELGPQALVLSTAMVPVPGWRGYLGAREVEITAAAERELSVGRTNASPNRHGSVDPEAAGIAARLKAAGIDRGIADEIAASMDTAT